MLHFLMHGLSPVFCPAGPESKPFSRRAKLATPIAKPLAAPVRMTPCPTRWFRDPLDNAIKKLVLGGSHGLARSSQNRSPALWGRVERAGEASWCWVHAMGAYLRARGASAIHGYPVCPTGRREQRVLSGVKDGRLHINWINRSMSACITRRATRPSAGASPAGSWVVPRRWAGGWVVPRRWRSPCACKVYPITAARRVH